MSKRPPSSPLKGQTLHRRKTNDNKEPDNLVPYSNEMEIDNEHGVERRAHVFRDNDNDIPRVFRDDPPPYNQFPDNGVTNSVASTPPAFSRNNIAALINRAIAAGSAGHQNRARSAGSGTHQARQSDAQVEVPKVAHKPTEREFIALFEDLPPFPSHFLLRWNRIDEAISIHNVKAPSCRDTILISFMDGVMDTVEIVGQEGKGTEKEVGGGGWPGERVYDDRWARMPELRRIVGVGMREVPGRLYEVFKWD